MSVSLEAFGIDRLSVGDRLDLIELIWDSLPQSVAPDEVPEWHLEILAKRLRDAEENPQPGRPWREVLSELGVQTPQ